MKEIRLDRLTLLNIEWNRYNAFLIEALAIDVVFGEHDYQSALFGFAISSDYVLINFLFFNFYWEF